MWQSDLSPSPRNLSSLFCCILSIFALIRLFHMSLFCAVIKRDSFLVLGFQFSAMSRSSCIQSTQFDAWSINKVFFPSYLCFLVFVVYFFDAILTSAWVYLPTANSTYHGFRDEVYVSIGYLLHFQIFYYPSLRGQIIGFVINPWHGDIFIPYFNFLKDFLIYI